MARTLILLPDRDFDPTETAVPWSYLKAAGHEVQFATPSGNPGEADPRLVEKGFGPLSAFFMSRDDPLARYRQMTADPAYRQPLTYEEIDFDAFDAIIIPGGHAPGMKVMLESPLLQRLVVHFFRKNWPVGAICHGVLLLARSIDHETGRSVLYGRRTTALPRRFELPAWGVTYPFLGDYYRTYGTTVEEEVTAALEDEGHFLAGPLLPRRDGPDNLERGFTVRDENYLSCRWPGDAYRFAAEFVELVEAHEARQAAAQQAAEERMEP
ncbi:MAG: type 1 glutamine amidotransferase domain-containing protein [Candidatus Promineifilaceae bacterium]|nr:type 1 glutamine amidotransferase domain-containing protein [Candidatus Promineifilaceae bacterium]